MARRPSVQYALSVVNPLADRPLHRQLADLLRGRIQTGELAPGAHLPSERAIADQYSISVDVVHDALAVLRAERLLLPAPDRRLRVAPAHPATVVTVPGGTVVSARMPTPAERYREEIPDGVPVLVVGGAVYPADRTTLRTETAHR
jgi:GntR family transcriptional regulator